MPRVASLKKVDYLNRPWLIRKVPFAMDTARSKSKQEDKDLKKEYAHVKSRYKGRSMRLKLANRLLANASNASATNTNEDSII